MPEPVDSGSSSAQSQTGTPTFPGVVPRKGTVKIIDGKKVIFDENGKP